MEKAINIFNVFPYIELEDYNLRKVNESDYKEIYDIYSDEETVKFEGIEAIKTDTQAKEYIQNILNGYENKYFVRWCVESKKSNKVIGLLAIHHFDFRNYNAQIGYILNKSYWRENIMSTVLKEIIKYIFNETEIYRLEANIHPDNKASIKLAEKLGFTKEGLKKCSEYNCATQEFEDRIILGIINDKSIERDTYSSYARKGD